MAVQETVLINFEVDYKELTNAQEQLAKTGKIDTKGFNDIQKAINTTATDSKGLIRQFKDVAGASIKMGKTMEDAFAGGINDALKEAGVSMKDFEGALKKANAPAITLKKELQQLKESMARMKAEGKDTGKEFDALRQRAGKLSDAIADANAEIKNAGSDTRGIDNVVGSISALAGGYSALQGATALFGEENEDLQKSLLKVNAAMALATGLQQIYTAVQKEGALAKLADSVVTGVQTAATTLLTYVTTGATVAARAYRVALLATGIGAVVVLVLALVSALDSQADSMEAVNKTIEDNNRLLEESNKLIVRQSVLQEERAKAAGAAESELLRIRGKALVAQRDNIIAENKSLAAQRDRLKSTSLEYGALNKRIEENLNLQRDLNYQIEILNIQGTAQVKKEFKERLKADKEFNDKKKTAAEEALKKLTALEMSELDTKVKAQLTALSKQEDQLRIHFENEQEIINRDKQQKLANEKAWDDQRLAMQKSFTDGSIAEIERLKAAEKKKTDDQISNSQRYLALAQQTASLLGQIGQIQTDRDQQEIASQRQVVEEKLKAGAITEKAAEAEKKKIDAIERKYRYQAALREKKAASFQAVLAIPQAFLQGLTSAPPPYGAILGAIAAALAAAQAAIIISKPVPKFFRGKKDSYAGPGIVGDMGTELVERNGRMFLYTKPTETYLGANDKVYTAAETRQRMHNTNISTTVKQQPVKEFDYDRLGKAIPANSININIDKDFISESVAGALSRTNYMDRRYSSKR